MFYIEDNKISFRFKDDVDDSIWNNIETRLEESIDEQIERMMFGVGFRPYSRNDISVAGIKISLTEVDYELCVS
jgi:hypothetical protein